MKDLFALLKQKTRYVHLIKTLAYAKWAIVLFLFAACSSKSNKDVPPIFSSSLDHKHYSGFSIVNDSMFILLTDNYHSRRGSDFCWYYLNVKNKKTVKTSVCFLDTIPIESIQEGEEIDLSHPVFKHATVDYNKGSRGYVSDTRILFSNKDHEVITAFDMYTYDNARISHVYNYKNYLIVVGPDLHESDRSNWVYVYDLNAFVY